MRAALLHRYGHEHITIAELDAPRPGPGEVLVTVEAASINPADWHKAAGAPYFMRLTEGLRRPKTERVGTDGAGRIDAVGAGVTDLQVGDRVFGSFKGSFATQALASVERIARVPTGVEVDEAAGLPIAGVTALQAVERAGVAGRRVVVNGASGGVGTFAVQLARAEGAAEVVGVCSGRNRELVRALGADRVVDYETEDFTEQPFDVLIDCVGSKKPRAVKRALSEDGVWVLLGSRQKRGLFGPLGQMLTSMAAMSIARQSLVVFIAEETVPRLERLAQFMAEGKIRTVIDRIVVLDVVTGAFDYLATSRAQGKVLILPGR